jgi:hypothetical protein
VVREGEDVRRVAPRAVAGLRLVRFPNSDNVVHFPRRHGGSDAVTPDTVMSDLLGTKLADVVVAGRRQAGGIIVAASSDDVDRALALLDEARDRLLDVKRRHEPE